MSTEETELVKFYQAQFTTNQEHLVQTMGSQLRGYLTPGSYKGESAEVVKQYGSTKARVGNVDRLGDTPIMTTPLDQRWVFPEKVDWGTGFEKLDQLKILVDITSPINQGAAWAMGRAIDEDLIMPAFFGSANTGKNGSTVTAYPSDATSDVNIQVGSADGATDTGLNAAKVIRGKKLLRRSKVNIDNERVFCGISSTQEEDLLNDSKYTDRDFGEPVLDHGRLKRWLGVEFVVNDMFPWAANIRSCPMWVQRGMHLGVWEDLTVNIGPDPGKQFNIFTYMKQFMGVTRTQEKLVKKILCKDLDGLAAG